MFRSTNAILKKAAAALISVGFFAAAIFLTADLCASANAAPASSAIAVEPAFFLAMDKPQRPVPKLHLHDLASLSEDEMEMLAALPAPDLSAELNGWTYTQSGLLHDFANFGNALYQYEVAAARQGIYNYLGLLIKGLSFFNFNGLLTPFINELSMIQNTFSCFC